MAGTVIIKDLGDIVKHCEYLFTHGNATHVPELASMLAHVALEVQALAKMVKELMPNVSKPVITRLAGCRNGHHLTPPNTSCDCGALTGIGEQSCPTK